MVFIFVKFPNRFVFSDVRHLTPTVRQICDCGVGHFPPIVRQICDCGVGHFQCFVSQKSDCPANVLKAFQVSYLDVL